MEQMLNDDLLNVLKTEEVSGIESKEISALDYVPDEDSIQYYTAERGSKILDDTRPLFNYRSVNKKLKKLQRAENEKLKVDHEIK